MKLLLLLLQLQRDGRERVVRPTTSSATQRLYVCLNTLHYLLSVLHSIDRSIALQRHVVSHRRARSSSTQHQQWMPHLPT